jgi:hypothetical protein
MLAVMPEAGSVDADVRWRLWVQVPREDAETLPIFSREMSRKSVTVTSNIGAFE